MKIKLTFFWSNVRIGKFELMSCTAFRLLLHELNLQITATDINIEIIIERLTINFRLSERGVSILMLVS